LIAQNAPRDVGTVVTVEPRTWPQEDGKSLGAADAPVVIKEFSDFQCPYCRQFNSSMKDQIIQQLVETGNVRFEYHHYIVIDGNVGGSESRQAAEAAECAAVQGRFWDYQEMLFANQLGEGVGSFREERLKAFAGQVGLDQEQFDDCVDSRTYRDQVNRDHAEGQRLGVRGTPSLFVNDQKIVNPFDFASIQAAVDAALAQSSR
jgi:protein-disulfide isomerase